MMRGKKIIIFSSIIICIALLTIIVKTLSDTYKNFNISTTANFVESSKETVESSTESVENKQSYSLTYSFVKPKNAQSNIDVYTTYIDVRDEVTVEKYQEDRTSYIKDIMTQDLSDVAVTITFNKLIVYEKLKKIVDETDFEVNNVYTRYVRNGEKGGGYGEVNLKDGTTLDKINSYVNQNAAGTTAFGYISMSGLVDSKYLNLLENDYDIYLVDTSYDGYFRGITEKDGKMRNLIINPQTGKEKIYFNHHIYADYEEEHNIKYPGEK